MQQEKRAGYVKLGLKTEEQRQTLSCGNEEDAGTHNHHDALLEILLIVRNTLIINTN